MDKALLLKTCELTDQLIALQTPIRTLDSISWDKQIKEEFLDKSIRKIPL
jgi:hypothetical protein